MPGSASPVLKFSEDLRVSLPARSSSEILLLVWGAINTEAVQWEEIGNHSLRLSGGNLGFYGVSVPSVPLFTGAGEGLRQEHFETQVLLLWE